MVDVLSKENELPVEAGNGSAAVVCCPPVVDVGMGNPGIGG